MVTVVEHEPIVTSKECKPEANPVYTSSSPLASVIVAEPSDKPLHETFVWLVIVALGTGWVTFIVVVELHPFASVTV